MPYPQKSSPQSFETQIPVREIKRFNAPSYYVYTCVIARRVKLVPIRLLIDTGSPWTALSPKDWKLLGFIPRSIRIAENFPRIGFAGHSFERRIINDVELKFKNRLGNIITAIIPELSILVPLKTLPKGIEDKIDSVLGMDVSIPPFFDEEAKQWFIKFREHIKIKQQL